METVFVPELQLKQSSFLLALETTTTDDKRPQAARDDTNGRFQMRQKIVGNPRIKQQITVSCSSFEIGQGPGNP
eukprot:974510-Amphidinium_carterae.1